MLDPKEKSRIVESIGTHCYNYLSERYNLSPDELEDLQADLLDCLSDGEGDGLLDIFAHAHNLSRNNDERYDRGYRAESIFYRRR